MITAQELTEMGREHLGACVPVIVDQLAKLCPISEGEYDAARSRASSWRDLVTQLQAIRGGSFNPSAAENQWRRQARILHERSTEYERERACHLAGVPRWERQTLQSEWADYFAALHDLHRDAGKLKTNKVEMRSESEVQHGRQHLELILAGLGERMRVKP